MDTWIDATLIQCLSITWVGAVQGTALRSVIVIAEDVESEAAATIGRQQHPRHPQGGRDEEHPGGGMSAGGGRAGTDQ